jgi:hypothetical protein
LGWAVRNAKSLNFGQSRSQDLGPKLTILYEIPQNKACLYTNGYRTQNVFGFLGPSDSFSNLGLKTLFSLTVEVTKNPTFSTSFNGSLYGCGVEISEREWFAVFGLLQRL